MLAARAARRSQAASSGQGAGGAHGRTLSSTSESELQAQIDQPFTLDLASSMVLLLCMAASVAMSSVGIGGGTVYVPTFASLLSWSVKVATACSTAVITAGQLGGVAARLASRHPAHPRRPLVDYRLALMLAGPVNAGAISGVLLNIVLPDWALTFLLLLMMVPLTVRTGITGWRMWEAERAARRPPAAASDAAHGSDAEADDGSGPTAAAATPGGEGAECRLEHGEAQVGAAGGARRLVRGGHGGRQRATQRQGLLSRLLHSPVALDGVVELALAPDPPQRTLPTIPTVRYRVLRVGSHQAERAIAGRGALPAAPPAALPREAALTAAHMRRWRSASGRMRPPIEERRQPQQAGLHGLGASSCGGGDRKDGNGGACTALAAIAELPDSSDLEGGSGGASEEAGREAPPDDDEQALPAMEVPWRYVALVVAFWAAFDGLTVARGFTSFCSWQWGLLTGASVLVCVSLPLALWLRDCRQRQPSDSGGGGEASSASECGGTPPTEHKSGGSTGSDNGSAASGGGGGGSEGGACGGGAAEAGPDGDAWSACTMAVAMVVTYLAGLLGGLVGIGGGMLVVPLLLELGYLPQVATATSGLLVLISATGSLFAYAAAGRLNVQYSAVVGGACLPCALVGTALISRAVRRSGRASVLVLLLTAAIATGCVATLAFQGRQAVQALASGQDIGLEPLCP